MTPSGYQKQMTLLNTAPFLWKCPVALTASAIRIISGLHQSFFKAVFVLESTTAIA